MKPRKKTILIELDPDFDNDKAVLEAIKKHRKSLMDRFYTAKEADYEIVKGLLYCGSLDCVLLGEDIGFGVYMTALLQQLDN